MQRTINHRSVLEKASDFLVNTRETTKERAAKAKTFVHEKPILTAFLSLAAGLFMGLLLSRPRIVVIKAKGRP